MVFIDVNKQQEQIEGTFSNIFAEWYELTKQVYKTMAKQLDLKRASELITKAMVDACKDGADEIGEN